MPARERLASTVFDAAMGVAERYPEDDEVRRLVVLAGDLHYGVELALAYMNRGISGDNARRLQRAYEQFKQQFDTPGP